MTEKIKMQAVSGYILIHKNGENFITIQSKSEFFSQELVIKITYDCLTFKLPELSDRKTYKPSKTYKGWFKVTVKAEKQAGKYFFDEDSNSDEVIVYC